MTQSPMGGFWPATKRLTASLLAIWLIVNLFGAWFARDIDRWLGQRLGVGLWVVAQGALLLYLVIIVIYVTAMDRLEEGYLDTLGGKTEDSDAGTA